MVSVCRWLIEESIRFIVRFMWLVWNFVCVRCGFVYGICLIGCSIVLVILVMFVIWVVCVNICVVSMSLSMCVIMSLVVNVLVKIYCVVNRIM